MARPTPDDNYDNDWSHDYNSHKIVIIIVVGMMIRPFIGLHSVLIMITPVSRAASYRERLFIDFSIVLTKWLRYSESSSHHHVSRTFTLPQKHTATSTINS
jgi:hypothetical protein